MADKDDFSEVSFQVRGDGQESLLKILQFCKKIGGGGHSFQIVLDPENSDTRRTVYFDGDGADRVKDICLNGTLITRDYLEKKASMNKEKVVRELVQIAKLVMANPKVASENGNSDIIDFFATYDNLSDEDVHNWAELNGYDIGVVEEEAYRLASIMGKFLNGGRANEKGVLETDVDATQLALGIEVEAEHTPHTETAKRIALDHLAELTDYYTRLEIMESQ